MRAILTYHSIDPSGSPISIDPATFEGHVRWLASEAVSVVPLGEILSVPADKDAVAVTFDDALESFGSIAAPLLLEAGLPVTVFVVSDRVGGTNRWGHASDASVPELDILGWDDLLRLAEAGVELGAHTRTHPDLTRLSRDRVQDELEGCVHRIEDETGIRPRTLAYPFGFHDASSVEEARRLFDVGVTTDLSALGQTPDPLRLPRLDMVYFRRPDGLEGWGGPAFRLYLGLRRAGRSARELMRAGGRR